MTLPCPPESQCAPLCAPQGVLSVLPEGPMVQVAPGCPLGSESMFAHREVGITTTLPLAGVCRVSAAGG